MDDEKRFCKDLKIERVRKMEKRAKFEDLLGLTLENVKVDKRGDVISFFTTCGREFRMYHVQDCCENVGIEEIVGDFQDVLNSPILIAREDTNELDDSKEYDSATWTFYNISTNLGTVTIRWLGISNGYYSESVDFFEYFKD